MRDLRFPASEFADITLALILLDLACAAALTYCLLSGSAVYILEPDRQFSFISALPGSSRLEGCAVPVTVLPHD